MPTETDEPTRLTGYGRGNARPVGRPVAAPPPAAPKPADDFGEGLSRQARDRPATPQLPSLADIAPGAPDAASRPAATPPPPPQSPAESSASQAVRADTPEPFRFAEDFSLPAREEPVRIPANPRDVIGAQRAIKQQNADFETVARKHGLRYFRDDTGAFQVERDETGRPLFRETKFERGEHEGKPALVRRTQYGETEVKRPDISVSRDVSDPNVYWNFGGGQMEPIGHAKDLIVSGDPEIAGAAKELIQKRKAAYRAASLEPLTKRVSEADLAVKTAQRELADLDTELAALAEQITKVSENPLISARQGGVLGFGSKPLPEAEPIIRERDRLMARQAELLGRYDELQQSTSSEGALVRELSIARLDRDIWKLEAESEDVDDLAETRRAVLRRDGKPEEGDPVLKAIERKREEFGYKIGTHAEERAKLQELRDQQEAVEREVIREVGAMEPDAFVREAESLAERFENLSLTPPESRDSAWEREHNAAVRQQGRLAAHLGAIQDAGKRERILSNIASIEAERLIDAEDSAKSFWKPAGLAGYDARKKGDAFREDILKRLGPDMLERVERVATDKKLMRGEGFEESEPFRVLSTGNAFALNPDVLKPAPFRQGSDDYETAIDKAADELGLPDEQRTAYKRFYGNIARQQEADLRLRVQVNRNFGAWVKRNHPGIDPHDYSATWDLVDDFMRENTTVADEFWDPGKRFVQGFTAIASGLLKSIGYVTNQAGDYLHGTDTDASENPIWRWGQDIDDAMMAWVDPRQDEDVSGFLANALGSAAVFVIPAGAVGASARAAGLSEKATRMLTFATTAGMGAGVNSGMVVDEAKAYGLSDEDALMPFLYGGVIGIGEVIPVMQWARRLGGGGTTSSVRQALNRALIEMFEEMGQETANEAANNVIARIYYDRNRELFDGIDQAAGGGAFAGAVMSLFTSAVGGMRMARYHRNINHAIGDQLQHLETANQRIESLIEGERADELNRLVPPDEETGRARQIRQNAEQKLGEAMQAGNYELALEAKADIANALAFEAKIAGKVADAMEAVDTLLVASGQLPPVQGQALRGILDTMASGDMGAMTEVEAAAIAQLETETGSKFLQRLGSSVIVTDAGIEFMRGVNGDAVATLFPMTEAEQRKSVLDTKQVDATKPDPEAQTRQMEQEATSEAAPGTRITYTDRDGNPGEATIPPDARLVDGRRVNLENADEWLAEQGEYVTDIEPVADQSAPVESAPATEPTPAPIPGVPPLSEQLSPGRLLRVMQSSGITADLDNPGKVRLARLINERLSEELSRWGSVFPSIEVSERAFGMGGMSVSEQGGLTIHLGDLLNETQIRGILESPARLSRLVQEEAIHSVAVRILTRSDVERLWSSLPDATKSKVSGIYETEGTEASDFMRGHEFVRLVVQGRVNFRPDGNVEVDGELVSEGTLGRTTLEQIADFLEQILGYFVDTEAALRRDGADQHTISQVMETIERVESAYRAATGSLEAVQKAETVGDGIEPLGSEFRAKMPDTEGRQVSGRWHVVESDGIYSSEDDGYDAKLQPRDRTRRASREQVAKIAQRLDPERLSDSTTTDGGAPMSTTSGMVVSGNGRMMAIRMAYDQGGTRAQAYRDWLVANAPEFGLDPQVVSEMRRPVLVRVIEDFGGMTEVQFAERANMPAVLGMSLAEQAAQDARILMEDGNLRALFSPSESGGLMAASNREFLSGFVAATGDSANLMTARGEFSPALEPRVKRALIAAVVGPTEPDIIAALTEDVEGFRRVASAIAESASGLVDLSGTPMDINSGVTQALRDYISIVRDGGTVDGFLAQGALFGDGSRNFVSDSVLRLLGRHGRKSGKQIGDYLREYVRRAKLVDTSTMGMDLGVDETTPEAILSRLNEGTESTTPDQGAGTEPGAAAVQAEPTGQPQDVPTAQPATGTDQGAESGVRDLAEGQTDLFARGRRDPSPEGPGLFDGGEMGGDTTFSLASDTAQDGQRELREREAREQAQREQADRQGELFARAASAFKSAKERMGTTQDIREAGYILPDGTLLDFSGKREGGPRGARAMDHREIDYDGVPRDEYSAGMIEFMRMGAIRIDANSGLISTDGLVEITPQQQRRIKQVSQHANGLYLDMEDGSRRLALEVNNPAKALGVMRRFIAGEDVEGGTLFARPVTPAQDAEYLRLAKDPKANREQLQRMVDEAAKAAGYDVGPVWHGGADGFDVFDWGRMGEQGTTEGKGFYFSNDRDIAAGYADRHGGRLLKVYLRSGKSIDGKKRTISKSQWEKILRIVHEKSEAAEEGYSPLWDYGDLRSDGLSRVVRNAAINLYEYSESDVDAIAGFINGGADPELTYDAVYQVTGNTGIIEADAWGKVGHEIHIATAASHVKSADPITYDASGNVIPLSQRFNPDSDSILFNRPANDLSEDAQAIKDMMDQLNASVPTAEELADIYRQAGMEGDMKTVGRPDLANISGDEAVRRNVDVMDEARKERAERRDRATVVRQARESIRADMPGVKRRLLEIASDPETHGLPTDLQVAQSKLLVAQLTAEALASNDPAKLREVEILTWSYRETGAEQSRAFGIRADVFKSPRDRNAEFIAKTIFTPTAREQRKVDRALTPAAKSRVMGRLQGEIDNLREQVRAGQGTSEDLRRIRQLEAELETVREQRDKFQELADINGAKIAKVEKAFNKMGVTLDEVFNGEAYFRLRGAKVLTGAADSILNATEKTALNLFQKGLSYGRISEVTGLTKKEQQAIKVRLQDAVRQKIRAKLEAGMDVEDIDFDALGARPAGAPKRTLAEIEELEAKIFSMMGIGLGNTDVNERADRMVRKIRPSVKRTQGKLKQFTQRVESGNMPTEKDPSLTRRKDRYYQKPSQGELGVDGPKGFIDIGDNVQAAQIARIAQAAGNGNGFDMMFEFWINSILSGPLTQAVNILGNQANATWELTIQRAMEASVNSALGLIGQSDPTSAQWGEFRYLMRGIIPGLARAHVNALNTWYSETPFTQSDMLNVQMDIKEVFDKGGAIPPAIPGLMGKVARIPGRLLMFADEAFKSTIGQMEAGAMAYRIAKAEGHTGENLERRIRALMAPGSEAMHYAYSRAKDYAFQTAHDYDAGAPSMIRRAAGGIMQTVNTARTKIPGVRYFLPFVLTPYNIFLQGMRKSPLGTLIILARATEAGFYRIHNGTPFAVTYTRPEMIRHFAEQIVAWVAASLIYGAAEGDDDDESKFFLMTGSRPYEGPGPNALNQRTGMMPYTMRIGDFAIQYGRVEPMATILGTTIDSIKTLKQGRKTGDYTPVAAFANSLASQMEEKTFTQGIGDMIDLFRDQSGKRREDWVIGFAASWVPNIIRQPIREIDPYFRESRAGSPVERLATSVFSPLGERRRDEYGEVREKQGYPLTRVTIPMRAGAAAKPNRIDQTLLNWQQANPEEAWAPSPLRNTITVGGERYELNGKQLARYRELAGEEVLRIMRSVPLNVESPTEQDISRIQNGFRVARASARNKLLREMPEITASR